MALDFYTSRDRQEHLFSIENKQFIALEDILSEFEHWTGVLLDEFSDFTLDKGNQQTLLKIIDQYIQQTDLNRNKYKTIEILSFYSLIRYFYNRNIVLFAFGD